jgi:hypothetical protein
MSQINYREHQLGLLDISPVLSSVEAFADG